MKKDIKSLLIGAAAATVLVGTTAKVEAKVAVVQGTSTALARGSTFAWAPVEGVAVGVADPSIANPIAEERLHRAIESTLMARGYRPTAAPQAADLIVHYRVALAPRRETSVTGYGGGRVCGWRGCVARVPSYGVSTSSYTQGTLVLDLVERRTGRLVWRATSDKRVSAKDISQENLNALLKSMTKTLPPV